MTDDSTLATFLACKCKEFMTPFSQRSPPQEYMSCVDHRLVNVTGRVAFCTASAPDCILPYPSKLNTACTSVLPKKQLSQPVILLVVSHVYNLCRAQIGPRERTA